MTAALITQLELLPGLLASHLLLTVVALIGGIAISLPLALLVAGHPRVRAAVLMVASVVQTIPGLALLALMVPLLGRIGIVPALLALILYSMLPVLRNAVTGLAGVDAGLVEAARGLGLTDRQILLRVQLPLAWPVIIAGIRTATVWVVGMATLSTPVGASSLGNYIFSGLQTQNYTAVLVGCVAAAVLALVLDGVIRWLETAAARRSRPRFAAGLAVLAGLVIAGFVPLLPAMIERDRPQAVIGTKTFTEQYVLGRAMASVLEDAGFDTSLRESLGSTVAFEALTEGLIDTYVDYTGTVWANYMDETGNPGREAILEGVTEWLRREHGVGIAARLGFENTYALAMPSGRAAALGVTGIEDLASIDTELRIGGDYEFFGRPEWAALRDRYGLDFGSQVTMDSTLMYAAVVAGEVDVISAYSTDGRIAAFDLLVLDDSRSALPPYDALVLVSPNAPPGLATALQALDGSVPADAMRAANRRVDLDGETVEVVAREFAASVGAGPDRPTGASNE